MNQLSTQECGDEDETLGGHDDSAESLSKIPSLGNATGIGVSVKSPRDHTKTRSQLWMQQNVTHFAHSQYRLWQTFQPQFATYNAPMKIVQVVPDFGLGGIQKGGIVLADEMARLGHDVHVIGLAGGPRLQRHRENGPIHHVMERSDPAELLSLLGKLNPSVIHLHRHSFPERAIVQIAEVSDALLVTTPVFGRPPEDHALLGITRVCHVGIYAFRRFNRWMRFTTEEAIAAGVGYVPITPFQPSDAGEAAPMQQNRILIRQSLGIPRDAFVCGRIGRQHISKWDTTNAELIDQLLQRVPRACWISVGLPAEFHPKDLKTRWGNRFMHFDETSDFEFLEHVLSSLDVQLMFGCGECFASTICEAAGAGVPSIALATPLKDNGQAEQAIDGVTGFVVGNIEQAITHVQALEQNHTALQELKRSTGQHAHTHWTAASAAENLLALYEFWNSGQQVSSEYLRTMHRQAEQFSAAYPTRMLYLMSRPGLSRIMWRARLAAVECWPLFQAARLVKRLARPRTSRELRDAAEKWY